MQEGGSTLMNLNIVEGVEAVAAAAALMIAEADRAAASALSPDLAR